jgi:hypothetical protein
VAAVQWDERLISLTLLNGAAAGHSNDSEVGVALLVGAVAPRNGTKAC